MLVATLKNQLADFDLPILRHDIGAEECHDFKD